MVRLSFFDALIGTMPLCSDSVQDVGTRLAELNCIILDELG